MTRRWRVCAEERMALYSPIGLRPIDILTSGAPVGRVQAHLQMSDGADSWVDTGIEATITPSGIIAYPRLERAARPFGRLPRTYRVLIAAEFYLPLFRRNADSLEFEAHPYNDVFPPANYDDIKLSEPRPLYLVPLPNYPFPAHIPVIRGIVRAADDEPVGDVLIKRGNEVRAVTDRRGTFACALPRVAPGTHPTIDAIDERNNRTGSKTIDFPQDLRTSLTISIA